MCSCPTNSNNMGYLLAALGVVAFLLIVFRKKIGPMWRFIWTKVFLINFFLALIVASLVFWGLLAYLDNFTLHGQKIAVPNYYGMHVEELGQFSEEKNLNYKIIDSVYSDESPRGTVIWQKPTAHSENIESFVKPDRTIYLKVVRSGIEYKTLPSLEGSKDIAVAKLNILGLNYKPNPVPGPFPNFVYGAFYKGKPVKEGQKVPKGATIRLDIGIGDKGGVTSVPNVQCSTIQQAYQTLSTYTLFPQLHCDDCVTKEDSLNAIIYKQVPRPVSVENSTVSQGADLVMFASVNHSCEPQTDTTAADTSRTP